VDDGPLIRRTGAIAARVVIQLLAVSILDGCAVGGGPMTGVMAETGAVNAGGKLDAHVHFSESTGVILGVEQQVERRVAPGSSVQWRTLGKLGYGNLITPSRVLGEELFLVGGFGRAPDRDGRLACAVLAGVQLAAPLSLARRREPWQSDDYARTWLELVPDVTGVLDVPTGGATANVEVSAALSLRVHLYSAVLP